MLSGAHCIHGCLEEWREGHEYCFYGRGLRPATLLHAHVLVPKFVNESEYDLKFHSSQIFLEVGIDVRKIGTGCLITPDFLIIPFGCALSSIENT